MWSSTLRLITVAALVSGLGAARAGAADPVYLEVRLLPVTVTGSGRTWDVTPVLKFVSVDGARLACASLPAVVEAFVRDLALPVGAVKSGGGPDLAALASRLRERAAAVLGGGEPKVVHVALGALHPADFRDGTVGFPVPRQCTDLPETPSKGAAAKPARVPGGNGAR